LQAHSAQAHLPPISLCPLKKSHSPNVQAKIICGSQPKTQMEAASTPSALGAYDGPIGPMLENHRGQSFHLAGRLEIDEWGGRRKAKLRLEDAAVAN